MQALANSRMMDDGPYCMSTKGQSGSSTLSGDPGLNLLVHFENAIPLCDALLLTRRNSEWNRPISSPSPPGDSWQKPLSGVIFRHQEPQVSADHNEQSGMRAAGPHLLRFLEKGNFRKQVFRQL